MSSWRAVLKLAAVVLDALVKDGRLLAMGANKGRRYGLPGRQDGTGDAALGASSGALGRG